MLYSRRLGQKFKKENFLANIMKRSGRKQTRVQEIIKKSKCLERNTLKIADYYKEVKTK